MHRGLCYTRKLFFQIVLHSNVPKIKCPGSDSRSVNQHGLLGSVELNFLPASFGLTLGWPHMLCCIISTPPTPQRLPWPSTPSQIHDLFFYNYHCNTYCIHNLLSPFSIALMYMCLGPITWIWITHWRFIPRENRWPLSQQALLACSFSCRGWGFVKYPPFTLARVLVLWLLKSLKHTGSVCITDDANAGGKRPK